MIRERTPWMTAIGVLDIVIGVLTILMAAALFYGGVQINTSVKTITAGLDDTSNREFATEEVLQLANRAEHELNAAQAFILPDVSMTIILAMVLIIAGIGTLKVARWARPISLAWAVACLAWLVLLEIIEPVDFDSLSLLVLLYPFVVLYLFSTGAWKRAFRQASSAGEVDPG